METESVFITDVASIKAFIDTRRKEANYFEHVMDRIMSKRKA
jgi:hypothetical protein